MPREKSHGSRVYKLVGEPGPGARHRLRTNTNESTPGSIPLSCFLSLSEKLLIRCRGYSISRRTAKLDGAQLA